MDKKTIVVTGGTGGIGTAICRQLSSEANVIACYYKGGRHEEAKAWKEEQKRAGFEIDTVYGNVSDYTDCTKIVDLISERYGAIDVLVNNAGVTRDVSLKRMTPEQWQQVIDANLTSVFNMTRQVLPMMLDQNYGRIINISSINGHKGQFGQSNYASSKSALYGFTKSLALEVASKGITVNTISPGYVDTAMLSGVKQEVLDGIIANIPVGRLGDPKDIAHAVAFLASTDSSFITGADLNVNGGQYM